MTSIIKFLGIRGGIAVALAIALGVVMWRADAISEQRDDYRDKLAGEQASHAVTRMSVDRLEGVLADVMEKARERAAEYERGRKEAERAAARMAEKARSSDEAIARLREIAKRGAASCKASPAILAELEGL